MQFNLIIPGKNWRLSLAELVSLLQAREVKFVVSSFSKSFFVFKIEKENSALNINDLGGVIKIGVESANFSTQSVRDAFLQKEKKARERISSEITASGLVDDIMKTDPEKAIFGVSVYCVDNSLRSASKIIQRFVGSSIKTRLLNLGKKSKFMGFSKSRRLPQLSHVEMLKKDMIKNKAEILFCVGKDRTFLATTVAVHNPFEFQKRDVGKPVQRKIFAISPRLARIMINLASCGKGKTLLDPFCGVGTILQEALLAKAKVIGVDINEWCIQATIRNMKWLEKEYRLENAEYRAIKGNVYRLTQKIGYEQVDCVATEPDLGPALRQIPTTSYAVRITKKLEPLYFGLLDEAYKVLKRGGRLVVVSPFIKTRSTKPVTMEIGKKALDIGFKKIHPFKKEFFTEDLVAPENIVAMASFVDAEKRHKIGREIHIFQK